MFIIQKELYLFIIKRVKVTPVFDIERRGMRCWERIVLDHRIVR